MFLCCTNLSSVMNFDSGNKSFLILIQIIFLVVAVTSKVVDAVILATFYDAAVVLNVAAVVATAASFLSQLMLYIFILVMAVIVVAVTVTKVFGLCCSCNCGYPCHGVYC
jgi:hypothetical protein